VPEPSPPAFSPAQIAKLERLLKAGFQFVTFEQFARYPGVEKSGFVALLELAGDSVRIFGSVGYHLGNGIGILVERGGKQAFVWKNESMDATPELLAAYESVKRELNTLLSDGGEGESNSPAGTSS
jgi:hypothetical protein